MRSLEMLDQLEVTATEKNAYSDTAGGVTLQMIAAGRWKGEATAGAMMQMRMPLWENWVQG